MVGIIVVFIARLLDPLSIGAAVLVAWLVAGAGFRTRFSVILLAALAISAGASVVYCFLQTSCREPFDGQGIMMWLIGAVASAAQLLVAQAVIGWIRRSGKARQ